MSISREQAFLKKLQGLTKEAKKNGNVTTEERIREIFSDLDEAQMDQIRSFLSASGIGIGEALPVEEVITEEERDYLQDYVDMIRQMDVPTGGLLDAIRLSAMAGEKEAQDRLALANLSMVVDIARLYAGQGVLMEDLIGTGNAELAIAVTLLGPLDKPEEVDPFLGERIMNAMEALVEANVAEKAVDEEAKELVNKVADKAAELAALLMRKVTPGELAKEGDLTREEILLACRISGFHIDDIDLTGNEV